MTSVRWFSRFSAYLLFVGLQFVSSTFYSTLLNGEKFKGFMTISPLGHDQYLISFDVKHSEDDVSWSVHMSSAPYDMVAITENCKRAKKSPKIVRDRPLNESTVSGSQIIGHTVILTSKRGLVTCATVILPGFPLLRASFHTATIEGYIHIIPLKQEARILPDLRSNPKLEKEEPKKGILEWAFVRRCPKNMTSLQTDDNELGVDSRTTLTIGIPANFTFQMIALLFDGELLTCSPITNVEIRQ
ncbi:hypothetical protein OSTOST_00017, partial [Ostertagia ostertagi]